MERFDLGMATIGLISDTHGLLRPDIHQAFAGVELILHAGAVGADEILHALALIAPVWAVYGNTDASDDPRLSPAIERVIGGLRAHLSHGHELGSPTPEKLLAAYSADVIAYGHTPRQRITRDDRRLVVHPAAAGTPRVHP